jgi:hypothetical protein
MRIALLAVAAALAAGTASAPAHAAHPRACGSIRVDRFLHRDAHGIFGAFHITAKGTSCRTARSTASAYIHDPEAVEQNPAHVHGWRCTNRATAPQEVRVTCSRGAKRIRFRDEIPSG